MNLIIFDVKKYITTFNKEAWYWLYQIDDKFREYASSEDGIREYKKIHFDVVIESNRTIYYLCGKIHREGDLPAVVWTNGTQLWYKNGKRHREGDLPAIIWADGTSEWYKNGKRIK
jgi:antitoxin component YwqK of YwqJK toxin-antitoxin module